MIQIKSERSECELYGNGVHEVTSMLIRSMSREASIELLARVKMGRLACCHDGQPYMTPMSFEYEAGCLYGFSTVGRKITWIRVNPQVCVEMEEVASRWAWSTVIVLGRYEELPKASHEADRRLAYDLFQRKPMWWEPAYVKTVINDKERPQEGVFFRIHIAEITGHRATPDS
ncbi:pyridoxamine 5'-phosphate oxidase family protein [soil metagenome]